MKTTKNKKLLDELTVWLDNFNKKYKKGLSELANAETTSLGKRILNKYKDAFKELARK